MNISSRLRSSGQTFKPVHRQMPQPTFGHLTATRVARAKKKNPTSIGAGLSHENVIRL